MSKVHVYRSWAVTLPNGNVVNFQDQLRAVAYWGDHGTEMVLRETAWPCQVPFRGFCGHCDACTYSKEV
jgi:hypothetical protein